MKMRRLAICAACSVTTFAASVSADTYPRQAGIDAVHLVVDHEQVIIEAWHEHGSFGGWACDQRPPGVVMAGYRTRRRPNAQTGS